MEKNRNIIIDINISELSKEGLRELGQFLMKYGYTNKLGISIIDL